MNGFQRVPVLQDGDFALTESVAIFRNLFQFLIIFYLHYFFALQRGKIFNIKRVVFPKLY